LPGSSHIQPKASQVRGLAEIAPNDLVLVSNREEASLAATKVELVICNRWEINPEYEKVLS
jgi:hypothetical protein